MERFLSEDTEEKNKPKHRGSLKKKILTIIVYLGFCCIMALVYMEWEDENDIKSRSVFAAKLHESVLEIEKQCPRLYSKEISIVEYRSFTMQKFDDITYLKDKLGIGNDYRKEAWTFIGAFFFVLTTTTTIGYGYPVPKTIQGKITTMLLYLVGVPFTFMALMDIVDLILTLEQFIGAQLFKMTKIMGKHIKTCLINICKNAYFKKVSKKKKNKKRNSVAPTSENVPKDGKKTGNGQLNQPVSFQKAKPSAIESVFVTNSVITATNSKADNEKNILKNSDSSKTETKATSQLRELVQKVSSMTALSFWIPYVTPSGSAETTKSFSDPSLTVAKDLKTSTFEVTADVHATANGSTTMIQPFNDKLDKTSNSGICEKEKGSNVQSMVSVNIGSHTELIPRNTLQENKSPVSNVDTDKREILMNETPKRSLSDSVIVQIEHNDGDDRKIACSGSKLNKCSSDSVVIQIESDSEDECTSEKYDSFKVFEQPKFFLGTDGSDNEAEMQINTNNNAKISVTNGNGHKKGSKSGVNGKNNMKKSMKHVLNRFSVKGGSMFPTDDIKNNARTININVVNPSTSNMPLENKNSKKRLPGPKISSKRISEISVRTKRSSAPPSREHSFYSAPSSRKTSFQSSYYPASRRSSKLSRYNSQPTSRWSSLHKASVAAAQKNEELQAAQDAESLPHLTMAFTMSNLIIYICLGAIMYVKFEGWTYLDSIYFILTSISTVGFGDLLPKNELFLLQSSFYILLGLALLAKVVGDIRRSMYNFMVQTISTIEDVGLTAKKKIAQSAKKMSLMQLSKRASFSKSRKSSKQTINSAAPSIKESTGTVLSQEQILNVKDLNSKWFDRKSLQDNSIQAKWPDHLPLPGHQTTRPWSASMQGHYHTVSALTPYVITDIPENDDTPSN